MNKRLGEPVKRDSVDVLDEIRGAIVKRKKVLAEQMADMAQLHEKAVRCKDTELTLTLAIRKAEVKAALTELMRTEEQIINPVLIYKQES